MKSCWCIDDLGLCKEDWIYVTVCSHCLIFTPLSKHISNTLSREMYLSWYLLHYRSLWNWFRKISCGNFHWFYISYIASERNCLIWPTGCMNQTLQRHLMFYLEMLCFCLSSVTYRKHLPTYKRRSCAVSICFFFADVPKHVMWFSCVIHRSISLLARCTQLICTNDPLPHVFFIIIIIQQYYLDSHGTNLTRNRLTKIS